MKTGQIKRKMSSILKPSLPLLLIFLCFGAVRAATLTVTNTNGSGAGSLPDIVSQAADGDVIVFDLPNCPCVLGLNGEIIIDKHLTISGPGARQLKIVKLDTSGRIFTVSAGKTVSIGGLTLTRPDNNLLTGTIIANSGELTVADSLISGGHSAGSGGAIHNFSGGTLSVVNSTLTGNIAVLFGGAVYNGGGTVRILNSTVSGNAGYVGGGGIYTAGGSLTVTNSTIAGNVMATVEPNPAQGGGIHVAGGTAVLDNSIVAGNTRESGIANDVYGTVATANHNLIGDAATSGGIVDGVNGNIVGNNGVGTIDVNAVIAPLADHGGPTPTHALLAGSPAVNAGSNSLAVDSSGNPLAFDQRGSGFPRLIGAAVDIGAFEFFLDADGDAFPDGDDNCPLVSNPDQTDSDADGAGNACDADDDNDAVADAADNCPLTSNADQADFDLDGIGDACDAQTGPVANKEQCKEGGWMRFNYPRTFINQGDCLRFLLFGD